MTEEEVYFDALAFAVKAHGPQLDRSGFPYILHPVRIAEQFILNDQMPLAILALLHDVVEDTAVTLENIKSKFGTQVATSIDHLTHRKGQETYKQYIKRVTHDHAAVLVKLADIRDNLYRRGGVNSGEEKRYLDAIVVLEKARQLTYVKCPCCDG